VTDWATISSLATAGGTLVLAVATFSAVRSSNRSARIAEQALQEQRRPVLVHARLDDPVQKIMFGDGHWVRAEGSQAVIDENDGNLYLALALRNVGAGIAVLQGWRAWPERVLGDVGHPPVEDFPPHTRDLYIAPGDVGLWQGALRDPDDELHGGIVAARRAAAAQPRPALQRPGRRPAHDQQVRPHAGGRGPLVGERHPPLEPGLLRPALSPHTAMDLDDGYDYASIRVENPFRDC